MHFKKSTSAANTNKLAIATNFFWGVELAFGKIPVGRELEPGG